MSNLSVESATVKWTRLPLGFLSGSGEDHWVVHRQIMSIFPENLTEDTSETGRRAHSGILYRVHKPTYTDRGYILVQSSTLPETLPADARTLTRELSYRQGQQVHFTVAVNPSRRSSRTGKTVERSLPSHQVQGWIAEKLSPAMRVDSILDIDTARTRHGRHTINAHHISGYGTVTDPEAMRNLCLSGVGRSKSYGCGLLTTT